jgi:hypothetical protein
VAIAIEVPDRHRLTRKRTDVDRCVWIPFSQPTFEGRGFNAIVSIERFAGERRKLDVRGRINDQDWMQTNPPPAEEVWPIGDYNHEANRADRLPGNAAKRRKAPVLLASCWPNLPEDGGTTHALGRIAIHRDGEPTAEPVSSPRRPNGLV